MFLQITIGKKIIYPFENLQSNQFFKHTFCEFIQVNDFEIPAENHFKSKSDSFYFYTDEGVYRKSNHWGRVANCRWKIIANDNYKNQNEVVGFAKWTEFYPINSNEKLFFIEVNFENKLVEIHPKKEKSEEKVYQLNDAQQKVKQIRKLFSDDKWANYYDEDVDVLRLEIITEFVNTNKTLQEIKKTLI